MEKFVTVEVSKDTSVVRGERAVIEPKETGSRQTVNNPGCTYNIIDLGGSINCSVGWCLAVEDVVRIEQIIFM